MSIIDKMCEKMGLSDPEDEKMDFDEENSREEEKQAEERREARKDNTVVDFPSGGAGSAPAHDNVVTSYRMKVIVIEPKNFDDAQLVANNLREKKPVVINFENTQPEDAKRIIDFISGTTYALNGEIKKVGHNVFLCAPSNVNVTYTEEERKVSNEMPWLKK